MATIPLHAPRPAAPRAGAQPDTAEAWIGEQRRRIVAYVRDHGPCDAAEIPRRWPLTRRYLGYLVGRLVEEGILEYVAGDRRTVSAVEPLDGARPGRRGVARRAFLQAARLDE